MALRFVPYIGAVIAAIFPLVVAAAVGERVEYGLIDRRPVLDRVAVGGTRRRTDALRAQQWTVSGCHRHIGNILDLAMGADWLGTGDPVDDLSCRSGAAC